MIITSLGLSCLKLVERDTTVLTDPYTIAFGLKPVRLSAALVICSTLSPAIDPAVAQGEPQVISGPGEFEVRGVSVWGQKSGDAAGSPTIYLIQWGGVSIGFLGTLAGPLSEAAQGLIDGVDVLFIPVGGTNVLDAETAAKLVGQVEPRLVVPIYYKVPGLKTTLDPVSRFTEELGVKKVEEVGKLAITKKDLPTEGMRTVVITPQI